MCSSLCEAAARTRWVRSAAICEYTSRCVADSCTLCDHYCMLYVKTNQLDASNSNTIMTAMLVVAFVVRVAVCRQWHHGGWSTANIASATQQNDSMSVNCVFVTCKQRAWYDLTQSNVLNTAPVNSLSSFLRFSDLSTLKFVFKYIRSSFGKTLNFIPLSVFEFELCVAAQLWNSTFSTTVSSPITSPLGNMSLKTCI